MPDNQVKITKEMLIGEILNVKPSAMKVIEKYFGSGCFTCPGMKMENLSFCAAMHGCDVEDIVKEINEL